MFQVRRYGRDTQRAYGVVIELKTATASASSSGTENRHSSRSRKVTKKVAVELKTRLYTSDKATFEGMSSVGGGASGGAFALGRYT
eukprot:8862-Heterococcus_DN1.PRE.2